MGLGTINLNFVDCTRALWTDTSNLFKKELTGNCSNSNLELTSGMNNKPRMLCCFLVAIFAFCTTTFYSWVHFAANKDLFFATQICGSIIVLFLIYILANPRGKTVRSTFLGWRSNWHILVLHSLLLLMNGNDLKQHSDSGGGSEFNQLYYAISVPTVIIWMQQKTEEPTNKTASILLMISSCVKVLVLARDHAFNTPVSTSLSSLLIAVTYGLFLICTHNYLKRNHVISLIQLLISFQLPLLCLLSIFYGEGSSLVENLKEHKEGSLLLLLNLFLLALLEFLRMVFMFLLLKISTPLVCLVTLNLSWIPLALIRVFVYKFVFLVASFKVSCLYVLDIFILLIKDKADVLDRTFDRSNSMA